MRGKTFLEQNAASPQTRLSVKQTENPLDIIGKVMNSTIFLSVIALAIACGVGWAVWKG